MTHAVFLGFSHLFMDWWRASVTCTQFITFQMPVETNHEIFGGFVIQEPEAGRLKADERAPDAMRARAMPTTRLSWSFLNYRDNSWESLAWLGYQPSLSLSWSSLKGHCHAIWQLYKKLKDIFASTEYDLVLLLKTIWRHWNCFLSPVACRYGWHGWKWIENLKNWPIFSSFDATCSKHRQKKYYG